MRNVFFTNPRPNAPSPFARRAGENTGACWRVPGQSVLREPGIERQTAAYAWHTFLVSAAGVSVPAVSSIAGTWWGCQTETRSKKDKMDREFYFESLQVLGWLDAMLGTSARPNFFLSFFRPLYCRWVESDSLWAKSPTGPHSRALWVPEGWVR